MNFNTVLLALLLIMVVKQWHPEYLLLAQIGGGYLIGDYFYRLGLRHQARRALEKAERAAEHAHHERGRQYLEEMNLIRRKYDPEWKWNEITRVPQEYKDEIEELQEKYKDYFLREFGADWRPGL